MGHLGIFIYSVARKIFSRASSTEETTETKKCMHCLRRIKTSHDKCPHCRSTDFAFDGG